MPWAAAGAVAGALITSNAQSSSSDKATKAQTRASQSSIQEQRRQFDAIQELLSPYIQAGEGALGAQQELLGLQGKGAQQSAIQGIQDSPQFQALQQQGESAILQNASATGGLRGGNVQAALAQFRPSMLNQQIQQQLANLGGVAGMGQASAAGQANLAQQQGVNISGQYGQIGAAQAGGALAQGQAQGSLYSGIARGIGTAAPAIYDYFNQPTTQTEMLAEQNRGF